MRYILFHGTDSHAAASIVANGLECSMSGFGQTMIAGCALQEDLVEAGRYRGDHRNHKSIVLAFEVEILNPFVVTDTDEWDRERGEHMRVLHRDHPDQWDKAVNDPLYWTNYLRGKGYDAAIIPSTLTAGGGREFIVFDKGSIELLAAFPA